jgi:hypothetical protein
MAEASRNPRYLCTNVPPGCQPSKISFREGVAVVGQQKSVEMYISQASGSCS